MEYNSLRLKEKASVNLLKALVGSKELIGLWVCGIWEVFNNVAFENIYDITHKHAAQCVFVCVCVWGGGDDAYVCPNPSNSSYKCIIKPLSRSILLVLRTKKVHKNDHTTVASYSGVKVGSCPSVGNRGQT